MVDDRRKQVIAKRAAWFAALTPEKRHEIEQRAKLRDELRSNHEYRRDQLRAGKKFARDRGLKPLK